MLPSNNNEISNESLNELKGYIKTIKKVVDKTGNIVKKDIKSDRTTFITPEYLKRALDTFCAYEPDQGEREGDLALGHKVIDALFTKNFIIINVKKAYKFIFGKEPADLKDDDTLKDTVKHISKNLGDEMTVIYNEAKKGARIVSANEQLKVITYLKEEVLPVFSRMYDKVLFFRSKDMPATTPELVSKVTDILEKNEKKNKKIVGKNKLSKGSLGDYTDVGHMLSTIGDDFKRLTKYDKIFDIWDKIIDEIDRW